MKMSSPIQKAIETAFKVFSRRSGNLTHESFADLKNHLNQVSKVELNIDQKLLENRVPNFDEAPVTYVRLLEDQLMTVAVFILRQGKRLPLHDHPRMHGFLKVIHGSVTINTFTPLNTSQYPVPSSLKDSLHQKYGRKINVFPTRFEGSRICSETDECNVITPDEKNIHEITSEQGTAAFLDILSPPYNNHSLFDRRPCSYYREIDTDSDDPNIRYLVRINPPNEYWCDEVLYTGPELPRDS